MVTLGGILFFLGFIAFCVSVVAVAHPLKTLHLGTRKRALAAVAATSVIAMMGSAMSGSFATSSGDLAPTGPNQTADADSAAPTAVDQAAVIAAASRYYQTYETTADHCNVAFQRVSAEANSRIPSIQTLYALATDARDKCRDTSMAFDGMRAPEGVTRDQRKGFDKASKGCALAYAGQQRAAEALMAALDDNLRPSRMARFREIGAEAAAGKIACAGQVVMASKAAGFDVPTE